MVANYADGERRFDSYANEADALDARDYVAASMTREQAIGYASATQALAPFNVTLAELLLDTAMPDGPAQADDADILGDDRLGPPDDQVPGQLAAQVGQPAPVGLIN